MYEQCSSDDKAKTQPLTAKEMRMHLREMFKQNKEASFIWQMSQRLRDPHQVEPGGRFRLNPLWLQLGVLAALALGTFLYFSFVR